MSIGKLPQGWVEAKISDVSTKCEQRIPALDENFIYIDIGSIDRESKKIVSPQYLLGCDAPSRARKVVNIGDVIVSLTRPNLNAVAQVDASLDGQIASTGFEVIKPLGVISSYLFALVRSQHFIHSISDQVQGALYPAAKSSDVQGYSFALPPLAEQQQIAAKLDELLAQVDSLKTRLDAIPKILKRFRQSVLAAAVSGKLTEDWREERNIQWEATWTKSNIGEISSVKTGKTPSRAEMSYWENGSIPWLSSSATGDAYCFNAKEFITAKAVKECTLPLFEIGTLLLAMYGEGKTRGQVTELKLAATCNQACAAIKVDESKALKEYVKLRLKENYEEIRKAASGGNQPNLNLAKVREIAIDLPSLVEQVEIVSRVGQLFAYADQIEQRVKDAQSRVNHLTQSILAKAFRGELTAEWREQNPDLISGVNSAEALLARIQAEREGSGKVIKRSRKVV